MYIWKMSETTAHDLRRPRGSIAHGLCRLSHFPDRLRYDNKGWQSFYSWAPWRATGNASWAIRSLIDLHNNPRTSTQLWVNCCEGICQDTFSSTSGNSNNDCKNTNDNTGAQAPRVEIGIEGSPAPQRLTFCVVSTSLYRLSYILYLYIHVHTSCAVPNPKPKPRYPYQQSIAETPKREGP